MTLLWCERAWLGGDRVEQGITLEIDASSIRSVVTDTQPPPGAEVLRGLTIPGLANAHSHAFHRALRGVAQVNGDTFWSWRTHMYRVADRLDPDNYRRLARATFAEMALAGTTAVGEFHYVHHGPGGTPYADPNEMSHALVAAAAEAGIRISLLDTCYLRGGIGAELSATQRRFADAGVEAWADRAAALSTPEHARIGAAVHSVRAVDPESVARVASWARERAAPLHAHVSEQPAENEASLAAYASTPVRLLADYGALDARFTAVHATHLNQADVQALGDAGVSCCLCPTTERDLGDGVGDGRALADAGAALCLGSDSHAAIDMFEEARAMELDQRLVTGTRGLHTAGELLTAATTAGHCSIGWPEAGRIRPGALADLVVIALDAPRLAGLERNPLEAVVFAATAADVRDVLIGGRRVVSEGRHLGLDVAQELRESIRAVLG